MNDAAHGERTFVSNAFGTVTDRRVIYQRDKGWLSGGSREDIPLKHVTAVRLETARNGLAGVLLVLVGLVLLFGQTPALILTGVVLIVCAYFLFRGSPSVVINTAGQDLRPARGTPWQRKEAQSFVEAVRAQLFRE
jgi:hypothetical protein